MAFLEFPAKYSPKPTYQPFQHDVSVKSFLVTTIDSFWADSTLPASSKWIVTQLSDDIDHKRFCLKQSF
uniref:Uncharacterized protein n=1 Tax=Tetranychus urticae TaxID=32264 RepID=T1JV77_TETUR